VISEQVQPDTKTVGVAITINNRLEKIDWYGHTRLFRRLWPGLLRAAILEALLERKRPGKPRPFDEVRFIDLLSTLETAKPQQSRPSPQTLGRTVAVRFVPRHSHHLSPNGKRGTCQRQLLRLSAVSCEGKTEDRKDFFYRRPQRSQRIDTSNVPLPIAIRFGLEGSQLLYNNIIQCSIEICHNPVMKLPCTRNFRRLTHGAGSLSALQLKYLGSRVGDCLSPSTGSASAGNASWAIFRRGALPVSTEPKTFEAFAVLTFKIAQFREDS
jgi:hypothetical protein